MPMCRTTLQWVDTYCKGASFRHLDTFLDLPSVYFQLIPICNHRTSFCNYKYPVSSFGLIFTLMEKIHQKLNRSDAEWSPHLLSLLCPGLAGVTCLQPSSTLRAALELTMSTPWVEFFLHTCLVKTLPSTYHVALSLLRSYKQSAFCLPAALPSPGQQLLQTFSLVPPCPSQNMGKWAVRSSSVSCHPQAGLSTHTPV